MVDDPNPDPGPVDDPTPDPKPDTSGLEGEVHRLRRLLAKHEKDAKDAEDKRKAEEGKWQQLAEERERERDAARSELTKFQREQRVAAEAAKVGFRDPNIAHRFLDEAAMDDPKLLETAFKDLRKQSGYLFAEQPPDPPGLRKVLKDGEPNGDKPGDVPDDASPMVRLEAAYAENSS